MRHKTQSLGQALVHCRAVVQFFLGNGLSTNVSLQVEQRPEGRDRVNWVELSLGTASFTSRQIIKGIEGNELLRGVSFSCQMSGKAGFNFPRFRRRQSDATRSDSTFAGFGNLMPLHFCFLSPKLRFLLGLFTFPFFHRSDFCRAQLRRSLGTCRWRNSNFFLHLLHGGFGRTRMRPRGQDLSRAGRFAVLRGHRIERFTGSRRSSLLWRHIFSSFLLTRWSGNRSHGTSLVGRHRTHGSCAIRRGSCGC